MPRTWSTVFNGLRIPTHGTTVNNSDALYGVSAHVALELRFSPRTGIVRFPNISHHVPSELGDLAKLLFSMLVSPAMKELPLASGLKLRPIRADDEPFLRRLYASTRQRELALAPWSAKQKDAFLNQQFEAQHHYYQTQFHNAALDVVEFQGTPIGRFYVDRREDEIRIIDIALIPEHRGQGLGGILMQSLLDEAATCGKRVTIHVELGNPAIRLYDRLGFAYAGEAGIHKFMEWTPP